MFRSDAGSVGTSSIRPVVVGNTTTPLAAQGSVSTIGPVTAGTTTKPLVLQGSTIESGAFGTGSAPLAVRGSSVTIENPVLGSAKLEGTSLAMETPPGYDIVVVMGQSNSVGSSREVQGTTVGTKVTGINPFYDVCDPRIFILPRYDTTYVMQADEPTGAQAPNGGGTSFNLTFCTQYLQHVPQNRKILIIHGGWTGTGFDGTVTGSISGSSGTLSWTSTDSNNLYTRVRDRTLAALATKYDSPRDVNRVVAFLWQQGTANTNMAPTIYFDRLSTLVYNIRNSVATTTTPFITGGFVADWIAPYSQPILDVLKGVADMASQYYISNCGYADSQAAPVPPPDAPNSIHWSIEGLRMMGIRYYNAYRTVIAKIPVTFTSLNVVSVGNYDFVNDLYRIQFTWMSKDGVAVDIYEATTPDGPFTLINTIYTVLPSTYTKTYVPSAQNVTYYYKVTIRNPLLSKTLMASLTIPAKPAVPNAPTNGLNFLLSFGESYLPTRNKVGVENIVKVGPSTVAEDPRLKSIVLPPTAMTGYTLTTSDGVFTASASTEITASNAWRPFAQIVNFSNRWRPSSRSYSSTAPYQYIAGIFSTTDTSSTVYAGEWIQMQSPVRVRVQTFSITAYSPQFAPGKFVILGKNGSGDTGWTLLNSQTSPVWPYSSTGSILPTITLLQDVAYTHFRIVFTNGGWDQGNPAQISILRIDIGGVFKPPPPNGRGWVYYQTSDSLIQSLSIQGYILPASYTKSIWVNNITGTQGHLLSSYPSAVLWNDDGYMSGGHNGSWKQVYDTQLTSVNINRWVHYALTYDSATTTMKLYRDGELISTNTSVPVATTSGLDVGSFGSISGHIQNVMMDNPRVYARALTAVEVHAIFWNEYAEEA